MRVKGYVAALGLASLAVVFQAGSAVAATLNLAFQNSRGTVTVNGTSLGSTTDAVPFEFSPVLGLGVLGGLFALKRFVKKKAS